MLPPPPPPCSDGMPQPSIFCIFSTHWINIINNTLVSSRKIIATQLHIMLNFSKLHNIHSPNKSLDVRDIDYKYFHEKEDLHKKEWIKKTTRLAVYILNHLNDHWKRGMYVVVLVFSEFTRVIIEQNQIVPSVERRAWAGAGAGLDTITTIPR